MKGNLASRVSLALCLVASCWAERYTFKNYGDQDGLTNLNVNSMYQDRDGFLWIGSDTRIFRYDGGRFQQFSSEMGLPQTIINVLSGDENGHLWVGTQDGIFILRSGRFEPILV
jgi:ligand-binding sensor domain-containing protein